MVVVGKTEETSMIGNSNRISWVLMEKPAKVSALVAVPTPNESRAPKKFQKYAPKITLKMARPFPNISTHCLCCSRHRMLAVVQLLIRKCLRRHMFRTFRTTPPRKKEPSTSTCP